MGEVCGCHVDHPLRMVCIDERTWRAGRFWWDSSHPADVGAHHLRAVIFDLDALTDVECGGHRLAFNAAFEAHGLGLRWTAARYRKLLALSDERQRVAAELRARGICTECDVLAKLLVDEICATKSRLADDSILDADLAPREGLVDLITEAFSVGVAVGVTSSGRRRWVEPLVRQLVGDGVVAFTGSPAGLRSASALGLAAVLVDPDVVGARADYDGLRIADCQRLRGRLWARGKRSAAA
jgi:phosphoglycolate phosphatase-like HAD superfamily hydrolase